MLTGVSKYQINPPSSIMELVPRYGHIETYLNPPPSITAPTLRS